MDFDPAFKKKLSEAAENARKISETGTFEDLANELSKAESIFEGFDRYQSLPQPVANGLAVMYIMGEQMRKNIGDGQDDGESWPAPRPPGRPQ